jgi:hypothetical protein
MKRIVPTFEAFEMCDLYPVHQDIANKVISELNNMSDEMIEEMKSLSKEEFLDRVREMIRKHFDTEPGDDNINKVLDKIKNN